MTEGHGRFDRAEAYRRAGDADRAAEAYEALIADYPRTWFDRTARERLTELRNRA